MTVDQPRAGFSEGDYTRPAASGGFNIEDIPSYTNSEHDSPDLNIEFLLSHFYKEYGSVISLKVTNPRGNIHRDNEDIFLTDIAFEWVDTGERYSKHVNVLVEDGETVELGLLNVDGPGISGEIEYRFLVQALERQSDNTYIKLVGGDDDWMPFTPGYISVLDEIDEMEYDYEINYYHYYDKTNELVTPDSPSIIYRARLETEQLGSVYKISKVAAIFDYANEDLTYVLEPEGEDEWQRPEELLSTMEGDCEDYSLLIAAMVNAIGGTSRMYLIEGHAFAAIYVGDTIRDLESAEDSINAYYNADLKIHYLEDETGYWIVADPLGSFYFGGAPVGSAPISGNDGWDWTFDDTDVVHAIDITGVVPEIVVWYNIIFWMFLMFITGIILIFASTYSSKKESVASDMVCSQCNMEINENPMTCPNCNARLHISCLNAGRYCPICGTMILAPPPPPIDLDPTPVHQVSPPPVRQIPPPPPPDE